MRLWFSSIQWFLFILAGSVVAPLAIGSAYHFSQFEIATFLQRTFFIIGLSSLLQASFGHKLPIMEGPAGLWWGIFLIFASSTSTIHTGIYTILRSIEMGLLISGGLFILMSLTRLIQIIKKIITPLVTGTYLILLVAQLSGSFIKGILGVNYLKSGVDMKVALPAIAVLAISIILANARNQLLRSYSVLIAMGIGWLLFSILGLLKPGSFHASLLFSAPEWLPWGSPRIDIGIILTSIITALLLLTNLIASVNVVGKVVHVPTQHVYNRSGFIMGINQIIAGFFSTVGLVPISYTAGFITTTKIKEKLPFILGNIMIAGISFFPPIAIFFSSIPTPVGYATIFLSFSKMISMGLKEYAVIQGNEQKMFIIGISLMVGIGSMFIPSDALASVPYFLISLLNNGLVLGVVSCIFLEQGTKLGNHLKTERTYNEIMREDLQSRK